MNARIHKEKRGERERERGEREREREEREREETRGERRERRERGERERERERERESFIMFSFWENPMDSPFKNCGPSTLVIIHKYPCAGAIP